MNAVLYAIPCAALTAVLLALVGAAWRCRALARALTRERVTARLMHAAWARDTEALQTPPHARHPLIDDPAGRRAVVDEATRITAQAAARSDNTPRGGGSDG